MSTLAAPDRSQIERMVRSILEQQLGPNGGPKPARPTATSRTWS